MTYQNQGQRGPRDNTNSGYLYPNDKKVRAEQPDLKGKINVNGVDMWLSAWNKQDQKTGQPFLSVKVSKIEPRAGQAAGGYRPTPPAPPAWQGAARQPPVPAGAAWGGQPSYAAGHGYAQSSPPVMPQQSSPGYGPAPAPAGGSPQHVNWQGGGDDIPF